MSLKVPRLSKTRHGVFYVRAVFFDENGKRHLRQHSLGTKKPEIARALALKFSLQIEERRMNKDGTNNLFEKKWTDEDRDTFFNKFELDLSKGIMKSDGTTEDRAAMMEAIKLYKELHGTLPPIQEAMNRKPPPQGFTPPPAPLALALPSITIKEAFEQHLEEEARRVAAGTMASGTLNEKTVLKNDFLACFDDIPLNLITTLEITKRWRRAEFDRPNKKKLGQKVSGARLEKRRGYLSKFFTWAMEGGHYSIQEKNPAAQKMATKSEIKDATQSYEEFNNDDIKKLFGLDYLKLMAEKPDWYWLPLMSLFSGARLGEVANLKLDDFEEIEGIKVFVIKKAKTKAGLRVVPIHSQLLGLGLWDYVQALKAKGETYLVAHRGEVKEKSAGREWGVHVSAVGITNKQKVFHSFRSTAITDMRNKDVNTASLQRSVGHTTADMGGVNGTVYTRSIQLVNLKKAVELLEYPFVDFSKLRLPDPTFSAFFEKENTLDEKQAKRKDIDDKHKQKKAEREERNRDKRRKAMT